MHPRAHPFAQCVVARRSAKQGFSIPQSQVCRSCGQPFRARDQVHWRETLRGQDGGQTAKIGADGVPTMRAPFTP